MILNPSAMSEQGLTLAYQRRLRSACARMDPELAGRFGALSAFLIEGLSKRATDALLVIPNPQVSLRARFRIDGSLAWSGRAPAPAGELIEGLRSMIASAGENPDKLFNTPIPFYAKWRGAGVGVAFRGQTELCQGALHVVLRTLGVFDRKAFLATLEREAMEEALGPAPSKSADRL